MNDKVINPTECRIRNGTVHGINYLICEGFDVAFLLAIYYSWGLSADLTVTV